MRGHIKFLLILVILIIIFFLVLQSPPSIAKDFACNTDVDCVPAQCCHSESAINKQFALDCKGTFCTAYCAPNTLDCGQGEIKCVSKLCKVVLK